ncbi:MAG: hypothetical protein EAX86_09625 [Candidatus Heimdallarchaeota archaeon]|nr:hypothetical protein [Candidatus Heimdallarchaeota archaeon]
MTTSDASAGLLNVTGENNFGPSPFDLDYTGGYYILTYWVDQSEFADDNQVTITVFDRVGNSQMMGLNCISDNNAPSQPIIINVLESSEYLYYNSTVLFHSNMKVGLSEVFYIRLTTSDGVGGAGLLNATGEDEFGTIPVDTSYLPESYYQVSYTISQGQSANENKITLTVYDRVGNSNYTDLGVYLDNTAPIISDFILLESSDFIYYLGGAIQKLWYSDKMPSVATFNMTLITSDGSSADSSGLQLVEFPAIFNQSIAYNDTTSPYIRRFSVSPIHTINESISIYSFDNVGNINSISLELIRDITAPSGNIVSIIENSLYTYRSADYTKLWYSNHMGSTLVPVSISIDSSDTGSSPSNIACILFPTIDDEFKINITSGTSIYNRIYNFSSSDTTNGDVFFTIYDNVGNTYQVSLRVIRDLTSPTIQLTDVTNPIFDPDGNELDNNNNWYDQGILTEGFNIFSTPNDPLSGLYQGSGIYTVYLNWDSTNNSDDQLNLNLGVDGDAAGIDPVSNIADDGDGTIILTLTVHDRVGNTAQKSMTIRFDNTEPKWEDFTPLHQNGPNIYLTGNTSDSGAGIQNITITDMNGNHFPNIIKSGFVDWILYNTAALDGDITPGENDTLFIEVFDNVNNTISYTVDITFHTIDFALFSHNIPRRVEIDNPGEWIINISFQIDGTYAEEFTPIIDRIIDLTQFSATINNSLLPIKPGSLKWFSDPEVHLQFTVILPTTGDFLTLGETWEKDIRVSWSIKTSQIDVEFNYTETNVLSYHDLEVKYVEDNLNITETDNPDIMYLVLHFEKDHVALPVQPSASYLTFFVDGGVAIVEGAIVEFTGDGNYRFPIRLPAGLPAGDKNITFIWQYNTGEYSHVIEDNNSFVELNTPVVRYHDIEISASIPAPMQLFEIDADFNFVINFTITEDFGNGTAPILIGSLSSSAFTAFRVNSVPFFSQTHNFVNLNNGDYSFEFDLYDENTSVTWKGTQNLYFKIYSVSGLFEWGHVTILGHDLQVSINFVRTEISQLQFFDPDERTSFEMDITVRDDQGSGFVSVAGLDASNFVEILMENEEGEDQTALITNLQTPGGWTGDNGQYRLIFVLEALAAAQLGYGSIKVVLTISDSNGHLATDLIIELTSRDFSTLLELKWIYIFGQYLNITEENASDVLFDNTFRVAVGEEIKLGFRIYAAEDPSKDVTTPVNIFWETPWDEANPLQNLTISRFVILNVTSNEITRRRFIAYAEGNYEKQVETSPPWQVYLEWDSLICTTNAEDDTPSSEDNPSVLNVNGSYILTYNAKFERSGIEVPNSKYIISLNLAQFLGSDWISVNGTLIEKLDEYRNQSFTILNGFVTFYHIDGNGTREFYINNSAGIIGRMFIIDDVSDVEALDGDGKIQLEFQFDDIFKVDLDIRLIDEIGTESRDYNYYSSYPTYPGSVYSFVDNIDNTIYLDTLIWTKFILNMTAIDNRIPVYTPATIYIDAYYAHNSSWMLDSNVYITLWDPATKTGEPRSTWINNRVTFSTVVKSTVIGVKFIISTIVDGNYGISLFEEINTGNSEVGEEIIWDQIWFDFFLAEPWGANLRFNVNTFANIQVIAYYKYDQTPFNGTFTTELLGKNIISQFVLSPSRWDENLTIQIPYPSDILIPISAIFSITNVTEDRWGLVGDSASYSFIAKYGDSGAKFLPLRWDRIIMRFTPDSDIYNPGDSIHMTLYPYYDKDKTPVDASNFIYTLYENDVLMAEKRSLLYFDDHEWSEVTNRYRIVYSYDSKTNLTGSFFPNGTLNPYIDISWVDRQDPRILERAVIDYGNGSIGFLLITTDDADDDEYFGSGVSTASVKLIINPSLPSRIVWNLTRYSMSGSSEVFFFGIISTLSGERDEFKWGDDISYTLNVTDFRGKSCIETYPLKLNEDSDVPFLESSVEFDYSPEIDGNFNISFIAIDQWAGLKAAYIRFYNSDQNKWSNIQNLSFNLESDDKRGLFWLNVNFEVGKTIPFELMIVDKSNNTNLIVDDILVVDQAGPHLDDIKFAYHQLGEFSIEITVTDNGSSIQRAILTYFSGTKRIDIPLIPLVGGGGGSAILTYKYEKHFAKVFTIPGMLFTAQTIRFELVLIDSEGNQRPINHDNLVKGLMITKGISKSPQNDVIISAISLELIQNPFILAFVLFVLLAIALVTIQRFRTVGGFDKKKVISDMVNISDTEVWEENDNISYGIVASFFDQVKGPVPIIIYPEKLQASEAMLASLSDRSFSTLGFVNKPEEDKHATFRFQIAGEKTTIFGYAFAIANPEARGGQENLSISFIIRPPWGNLENINKFLTELLEHLRKMRSLIEDQSEIKIVQRQMQETRNFYTRAMLTFRKKYGKEFVE